MNKIGFKRKLDLLGILLGLMLFVSCEYNVENEDLIIDSCDQAVSYIATIRPLIDNNCMPCHNGDGSIPQAPNLTALTGVQGIAGLIRDVTQSRRMPQNGTITDAEIEAIRCWVENGALDN